MIKMLQNSSSTVDTSALTVLALTYDIHSTIICLINKICFFIGFRKISVIGISSVLKNF